MLLKKTDKMKTDVYVLKVLYTYKTKNTGQNIIKSDMLLKKH